MAEAKGEDKQDLKTDLWKKMADNPYVMLALDGGHAEPMNVQLDQDVVDELYFFAGKDNRVAKGGAGSVSFVSKSHDFYASMRGQAQVVQDEARIDKLWNKQVEAWFPGGRQDPNLALVRFTIDSAELWENDLSLTGRLKMLTGQTITPSEGGTHAFVQTTAEGTPA